MRGETLTKRYLSGLRRAKGLVYRLLAALIIFVLAWALVQSGGAPGQMARGGIGYIVNANLDPSHYNLSPVIDQVGILLGFKKGIEVNVEKPIPLQDDASQTPGLPASGKLVRGFGWQKGKDGWPRFSGGLELEVTRGAPVHSVMAGKVSLVAKDTTLGTIVVVDHSDQLASLYGRLDAVGVQPGQVVAQGQVIGAAQSTYLHFGMRDGDQLVDPVQRLQQKQT